MIDLYDPNLSESEIQQKLAKDVAQRWKAETKEGREFEKFFASRPENIDTLAKVFDLLDEHLSFETLSAAYRMLRENGEILSEAEVEQARLEAERQQAEISRAKWQSDCESWLDSHSTREITERAKTDRAFRSYLKDANRIPQLAVEYSAEATAKQREAKKIQKQRDARFAHVSDDLWTFAETYKRLPAAEAFKRMAEPHFKTAVEACAKAGLI